MRPIDELRKKLESRPDLRFEEFADAITLYPQNEDGFTITLIETARELIVVFADGWHEHFNNDEAGADALNCFGFGMSEDCRLKIELAGNFPCRWIVEYRQDGNWIEDTTVGLFFYPYWRRIKTEYLQNRFILTNNSDSSVAGAVPDD